MPKTDEALLELVDGGNNPVRHTFKPLKRDLRPSDVGVSCARTDAVAHVGQIKLPVGAKWRVTNLSHRTAKGAVFLRDQKGSCVVGHGDLDAGVYDLYLPNWLFRDSSEAVLNIEDTERKLWFGDAPEQVVKRIDKPLLIPLAPRSSPSAPDVILHIKRPIEGWWMEAVMLGGGRPHPVRLDRAPLTVGSAVSDTKIAPGKIAVFLPPPKEGPQQDAPRWLLLRHPEGEQDSFKTIAKHNGDPMERTLKAGALPLAHRELHYVFPFLQPPESTLVKKQLPPMDELFAAAPDLLLFVTRDSGAAKQGEPVMLLTWGDDRSTVVRATGETVSVRTERLSTSPVDGATDWSWNWPEPDVPTVLASHEDVVRAEYRLPLSARSKFAAWRDKSRKVAKCMDRYRARNDPSYEKDYELIYTATGANVGDTIYKRARAKCGAKAHDRAAAKLIAKALKAQDKRQAALGARLKKAVMP